MGKPRRDQRDATWPQRPHLAIEVHLELAFQRDEELLLDVRVPRRFGTRLVARKVEHHVLPLHGSQREPIDHIECGELVDVSERPRSGGLTGWRGEIGVSRVDD